MGVPALFISGIAVADGGCVLELDGEALSAFPHGAFHVLFNEDLTDATGWRPVRQDVVGTLDFTNGTAQLPLPASALFGDAAPIPPPSGHDPLCLASTNTVISPLDPGVTYSHAACGCAASALAANPSGFLRIVSDVAVGGTPVPSWWCAMHGIDPLDLWTVPEGSSKTFVQMYLDGDNPTALGFSGGYGGGGGGEPPLDLDSLVNVMVLLSDIYSGRAAWALDFQSSCPSAGPT